MLFAQANAVEPHWLSQMWVFVVVMLGLVLGPAVTIWVSNRRQKREVVQGEEYVSRTAFNMAVAHHEGQLKELRARVDRLESDFSTAVRELRSDIGGQIAGVRQDIQLLVRAVGQLEGRLGRLELEKDHGPG